MLHPCLRQAAQALRTASTRTFTTLPIIDISALTALQQETPSLAKARRAVAQQLDSACREAGFFYVTNHGVPEQVLGAVLQEAREWFRLPEHEKATMQLRPETGFRGWQQLGSNVTRYDGGFQRDMHEALDFYKEEDPLRVQADGRMQSPIHAQNQWPRQRQSFDAALRVYVEHMLSVGRSLMRGISLGLGLEERFFEEDRAGDSYWCMRIIHYPPLRAADEPLAESLAVDGEIERSTQLSCGEHTDYGLLTLVNQDPGITALQVKNAAGHWVSAPPKPGTLVCNIGDCLKFWTNGEYQSTPHRVLNLNPLKSRVSAPFFYEPDFEATVQPIDQLRGCRTAQFPPVVYGRHLESKVLSNFEL